MAESEIDWWALKYENINPQLICPICQTALVSPVSTPCGHTFCKSCIGSLAEASETLKCPVDRKTVPADSLVSAPFLVHGLVNDLVVHCPFEKCDFKDKRWLLQSHIDLHCEYALVNCYEPCEKLCERRWRAKGKCCHEKVDCPNECGEAIALSDLDNHYMECEKAAWECPHCSEPFATTDKEQHEKECLEYPLYCTGKPVGCTFVTQRSEQEELDTHCKACPLALLSPLLTQQQDKIASLERESQTLHRQLDITKRQVKRDAANLDMHILMEYERLRSDVDHSMSQNDSNMKQMMMLARENLQMNDDLAFIRNSVSSLRHQVHYSINPRRFSMHIPPFPFMAEGRPDGRHDARYDLFEEPNNVKL